ncbi:hypothetical protein PTKIN_Ptkin07bG0063100 [Pterospermum kingtungense]
MEKNSGKGKEKESMDFQGYGLRDNPKKSWKFLGFGGGGGGGDDDDDDDGNTCSMLKFQCKACGKQFASMKSLFGHMRHHSRREKKGINCQECGRKFQSLKALDGHMRLHSEKLRVSAELGSGGLRQDLVLESITVRRKRSKRMRYNNAANSSLFSAVEMDQEVEDAALCLILLSVGARNWSECNSFWESSDNNAEIKSQLQNEEIVQNLFCVEDGSFRRNKPRVDKSDSDVSASMDAYCEENISECKASDSGVVTDKEKKIGSVAPRDMLYDEGVEFMVSKVDDESGFELYDTEIEERIAGEIVTFSSVEVEPGKDLMEGWDLAGLESRQFSSCKDAVFDACDAEPGGDSLNKLITTPLNSNMSDDPQKKNKYKCRICSRTFKSHQALGGHQTIHRNSNSCAVEDTENCEKISTSPETEASGKLVKIEYVENSVEQEMNGVTSYGTRVYKVHRCGICLKVFASGQALGGHKRSHILKDSETSDKQSAKQLPFSDISDVIDVNLPVMRNEEANGDIGFKSCRVGSDCKSEALLSLIAN